MKTQQRLAWYEVETEGSPGLRSRHGLVYDETSKSLVLFGGIHWKSDRLKSDTWELHENEWSKIRVYPSPPSRHRGAMVYDSKRGCTVLFGGQTSTLFFPRMLSDTWLYRDRRWTRAPGASQKHPSARCGHAMTFDEEIGMTVLFGGINWWDQPLGDTWTFDGDRWQRFEGQSPPARRYAAFAYHPELKGCVLHGGAVDDNGRQKFGDTWLFRDRKWVPLGAAFDTTERDDHGLAFHHELGSLVMLEGLLPHREVLIMTKQGWEPVEMESWHPRHQCSPMAYDSTLGGLVLHGGEAGHGGPQFEKTLVLRYIN